MDIKDIREIVKLFDESKANHLELKEDGFHLKLADKPAKVNQTVQSAPAEVPAPAAQQPQQQPQPQESADSADEAQVDPNVHEVKSPIVGTFYRAPSPDSEPFVEEGSKIKAGETLCIVEAMKLMNEIESDKSGTVVKILMENGEPVEYNQPIFHIKPD